MSELVANGGSESMNRCRVVMVLMGIMAITVAASPAAAQLTFDPASSYTVTEVWSGQDGAHFAMEAGDFYLYGKEATERGEYENVVRLYNGSTTVEVARTAPYTDYDRKARRRRGRRCILGSHGRPAGRHRNRLQKRLQRQ